MKYIDKKIEVLELSANYKLPKPPDFTTLYINGGKKNKLNKVDIVGFLAQKGKLEKTEIGLIEVKDFSSFVAVKESKLKTLLSLIKEEKIKGKKYKIEVANTKIVVKERERKRKSAPFGVALYEASTFLYTSSFVSFSIRFLLSAYQSTTSLGFLFSVCQISINGLNVSDPIPLCGAKVANIAPLPKNGSYTKSPM